MNPIIVFYLLVSSIHTVPLAIVTLSIQYDIPIEFFPKELVKRINRELRRNSNLQFEQLFKIINLDSKEYLASFCLVALLLQLLTMFLIVMAILFDVPLPFISNLDDILTMDIMNDLVKFSVLIACVHLIPMVFLVLALFYDIPLPFISTMTENHHHAPLDNENTNEEENFVGSASIRLTRLENEENTSITVNCEDRHLGQLLRMVVCQGKEPGATPQCFLCNSSGTTLEEITPAPVSVNQLDQMIISDENEVSV